MLLIDEYKIRMDVMYCIGEDMGLKRREGESIEDFAFRTLETFQYNDPLFGYDEDTGEYYMVSSFDEE